MLDASVLSEFSVWPLLSHVSCRSVVVSMPKLRASSAGRGISKGYTIHMFDEERAAFVDYCYKYGLNYSEGFRKLLALGLEQENKAATPRSDTEAESSGRPEEDRRRMDHSDLTMEEVMRTFGNLGVSEITIRFNLKTAEVEGSQETRGRQPGSARRTDPKL